MLAMAACESRPPVGEVGNVTGAIGGVATEEPSATLAAQDVLSAGGSAADAAVAAYFTLLVTYPVAVGIGGGGICVVYDQVGNVAETLDFRATGGDVAVPATLRGMAALHARYGRLPWASLIGAPESSARFGVPMSRALARKVAANEARIRANPGLSEIFVNEQGKLKGEGESYRQVALSGLLAAVRSRGVGDLYGGESGRALADAAAAAGAKLSIEDLRAYRATWRKTVPVEIDNITFHGSGEGAGAGGGVGLLLQQLPARPDAQAILAASRAAYKGGAGAPEDTGDAGVAVVDRRGQGVACGFTLGGDFGSGRMARDSGVILAQNRLISEAALAPVVGANMNTDQAYFAAAASGGWPAALAVSLVVRRVLDNREALDQAVGAPRVAQAGEGAPVLAEKAAIGQVPGAVEVPALGEVQAVWCANGAKSSPERCIGVTDPRGFGLARDGR